MAWEVYRGRHELAESRRQTGDKKELHPYFVPSEWQIQQIKQHNTTQMLVTVLKQHTQVAIKKHLIFQAFYSKLLKNIVDSDKKNKNKICLCGSQSTSLLLQYLYMLYENQLSEWKISIPIMFHIADNTKCDLVVGWSQHCRFPYFIPLHAAENTVNLMTSCL